MSTDRDEGAIYSAVHAIAQEMVPYTRALWHVGDGAGGGILKMFADAAGIDYFGGDRLAGQGRLKDRIPRSLAKLVFERDAYRCVTCGGHVDLTCDHIVPESLGGPTTFENLQTMCRPCNSRKGARAA